MAAAYAQGDAYIALQSVVRLNTHDYSRSKITALIASANGEAGEAGHVMEAAASTLADTVLV